MHKLPCHLSIIATFFIAKTKIIVKSLSRWNIWLRCRFKNVCIFFWKYDAITFIWHIKLLIYKVSNERKKKCWQRLLFQKFMHHSRSESTIAFFLLNISEFSWENLKTLENTLFSFSSQRRVTFVRNVKPTTTHETCTVAISWCGCSCCCCC